MFSSSLVSALGVARSGLREAGLAVSSWTSSETDASGAASNLRAGCFDGAGLSSSRVRRHGSLAFQHRRACLLEPR